MILTTSPRFVGDRTESTDQDADSPLFTYSNNVSITNACFHEQATSAGRRQDRRPRQQSSLLLSSFSTVQFESSDVDQEASVPACGAIRSPGHRLNSVGVMNFVTKMVIILF